MSDHRANHAWVRLGGLHFDSESPCGVTDRRHLSTFKDPPLRGAVGVKLKEEDFKELWSEGATQFLEIGMQPWSDSIPERRGTWRDHYIRVKHGSR